MHWTKCYLVNDSCLRIQSRLAVGGFRSCEEITFNKPGVCRLHNCIHLFTPDDQASGGIFSVDCVIVLPDLDHLVFPVCFIFSSSCITQLCFAHGERRFVSAVASWLQQWETRTPARSSCYPNPMRTTNKTHCCKNSHSKIKVNG